MSPKPRVGDAVVAPRVLPPPLRSVSARDRAPAATPAIIPSPPARTPIRPAASTAIVDAAHPTHPLNAAAGDCFDVPGPYAPPPPANVVSAACDGSDTATLVFDQPLLLNPAGPDGSSAMLVAGFAPFAATLDGPVTLRVRIADYVNPGAPWQIDAQPAWVLAPLAFPASGTF